jgi:hypothetical protein
MKKLLVILSLFFPFVTRAAGLVPCGGEGEPLCNLCYVFVMIDRIFDFFSLQIVPPISIILVVVSGFMMILSLGGQKWILFARNLLKSVVIATLVFYGAWMVINSSFAIFGVSKWQGITDGGFKVECSVPDKYYTPSTSTDYSSYNIDSNPVEINNPSTVYINPDVPSSFNYDPNQQLTEHFNLNEFESSQAVCGDINQDIPGCVDNFYDRLGKLRKGECLAMDRINNLKNLAVLLEKIRAEVNRLYSGDLGKDLGINISSSWRCREQNNNLVADKLNYKASETSLHMYGMAADIKVSGISADQLWEICNRINGGGGVGHYDTFVHVDIRGYEVDWDYRSTEDIKDKKAEIKEVSDRINYLVSSGRYYEISTETAKLSILNKELERIKSVYKSNLNREIEQLVRGGNTPEANKKKEELKRVDNL